MSSSNESGSKGSSSASKAKAGSRRYHDGADLIDEKLRVERHHLAQPLVRKVDEHAKVVEESERCLELVIEQVGCEGGDVCAAHHGDLFVRLGLKRVV